MGMGADLGVIGMLRLRRLARLSDCARGPERGGPAKK